MKKKIQPSILIALSSALIAFQTCAVGLGNQELEFSLPSIGSETIELKRSNASEINVVCFLGNECPIARHYAKRLSQISDKYADRDIRIIGINSNQHDSLEELTAFSKDLAINFDLGKDYDNKVADQFHARRTPEVFLLDNNLTVVYRGRIDNQYAPGVNRSIATEKYLVDAIEALLNKNTVSLQNTEAVGCIIGRVRQPIENPTVTYTKQVSRLIQKQCIECHRTGEIGPFALDNYEEVKGWAEMMVEVVEDGRMPPWHATNAHSEFVNARHLTSEEKQVFADWLQQGTPYGKVEELPKPRQFTKGWRLPRLPDKVVEMRAKPYVVPATGTVEYQYFVVDLEFEQDMWVSAAEVIPGNRSVVHHSIVFVRPPDGSPFKGIGWLAAYVPGQSNPLFKETHAQLVPAGSKLVFQQHYTPTGTEQTDITRIGLVFADPKKVTHEVYTLAALNQEFEIPAESNSHSVESKLHWYPKNGELVSVGPHMHYRGKSYELFCSVNGESKQLIDVPAYDFNWQHLYQFKEPIPLQEIDELKMQFRFDNSNANPFNPDFKQHVTWGDQTWEEMAVAFFTISEPRQTKEKNSNSPFAEQSQKKLVNSKKADNFVSDFFARFDANGDGNIVRDELPRAIGRFRFSEYDLDLDGKLTQEELRRTVADRFYNE